MELVHKSANCLECVWMLLVLRDGLKLRKSTWLQKNKI
jgi:hypothetical protein